MAEILEFVPRFFAIVFRPFRKLWVLLVLLLVWVRQYVLNAVASDFVASKVKAYASAHEWLDSGTDSLLWIIRHPVSGMFLVAAAILMVSSVAAFLHTYRSPLAQDSTPERILGHDSSVPALSPSVQFLPLDKRAVAQLANTVCLLLPVRNNGEVALQNIVAHLSYQPLLTGQPQSLEIDRGLWVERDSYDMFLDFGETARLVVAALAPSGCLAPSIASIPSPTTDLRRSLGISSWSSESYGAYQLPDASYRVKIVLKAQGFSCTATVLMTVEDQKVTGYTLEKAVSAR